MRGYYNEVRQNWVSLYRGLIVRECFRFVADKGFAGADSSRRLDGPVGFVRDDKEEEDPFGLNKFLSAAKQAQKRPADDSRGGGGSRDHERSKHKRRE